MSALRENRGERLIAGLWLSLFTIYALYLAVASIGILKLPLKPVDTNGWIVSVLLHSVLWFPLLIVMWGWNRWVSGKLPLLQLRTSAIVWVLLSLNSALDHRHFLPILLFVFFGGVASLAYLFIEVFQSLARHSRANSQY